MKKTLLFLTSIFLYTISTAQPSLGFIEVNLTGPPLVEPVDITGCGDNSGRLFIVEKRGTIRIILNDVVLEPFFLDIQDQVMNSGERGLLGLAFHQSYPATPYLYVNYVIEGTNTNRISRFTVSGNPNVVNEASELILLEQAGIQSNHKAGDIAFGPDGYLYIGMGDGGGGGDPNNTGQNNQILLGKMLRIDVNTAAPPLNYSIPPDNPFVGVSGLDEIWAMGMRNPWRISFDRQTGDFWIADVGQNQWEEVDMVPAGTPGGMNFGWDCQEGNHPYEPGNCSGNPTLTWPVFEYPHNCNPCPVGHGFSITGGFVYRGSGFPVLNGCYICADYGSNFLWLIKQTGSDPLTFDVFVQDGNGLVSELVTFGEDDDGELYASNLDGTLYDVTGSGTLPVQWENIIASIIPKGNRIQWTLHQTFGINHFELERSLRADFNDYSTIAHIQPVQDQITYTYEDLFIQPFSIYYRIAARLEDGSTEYSPVARILGDPVSKPALVYDQNSNIWRINLPDLWRNGEIALYDVLGKEVYKRIITTDQQIDLTPPIIPGSYYVKINGEMGTWSEKVIW